MLCWELNSGTCTHMYITADLLIHIINNNKKRNMELSVRCDQAYHKGKGSFASLQKPVLKKLFHKEMHV